METTTKPATYTVPEAAALLKISEWKAYDLVREGKLRTIPMVKPKRVPGEWLRRTVAGEE